MRALKFSAILIAAAIIFISARAYQQPGSYNTNGSGAPSGSCVSGSQYTDSSTGNLWTCSGSAWVGPLLKMFTGTSASLGGGALLAGACSTTTVTVTGATTGMAVVVSPSSNPGIGSMWYGYISSANTVTVAVCGVVALTPSSVTYNVRVLQ